MMTVNAIILLATGYVHIIMGSHPTGAFMLLLSISNVLGIVFERLNELEMYRKQQQLEYECEVEEDEDDEDEEEKVDNTAEEEEEDEEVDANDADDEDESKEESDVHYCGHEGCGKEITNLEGAGLCSGCGLVYYCDTKCQRADWKAGHKLVCDKEGSIGSVEREAPVEPETLETLETVPETVEPVEPVEAVAPVTPVKMNLPPPPPYGFSV